MTEQFESSKWAEEWVDFYVLYHGKYSTIQLQKFFFKFSNEHLGAA